MKDNVVIIFTRIPIPGKTKTRLQPLLSGEQCCQLHRAFLVDIYNVLRLSESMCDVVLYYVPDGDLGELKALFPDDLSYNAQVGDGLGAKMYNAISDMLSLGYKKCLLMGSDVPLFNRYMLDEAFRLLDKNDIVICPTIDGGYFLIGMKEPYEAAFCIGEFSTASVYERTVFAVEAAGRSCVVGPCTFDIDEPDDLYRLTELLRSEDPELCPQTRKVLRNFAL